MNTVIRKIGNSEGVILPKELPARMNLRAGDALVISQEKDDIVLSRAEDAFEHQMKAAGESPAPFFRDHAVEVAS